MHRRNRLFKKGDLVLIRTITKDRNEPRWSLPHRVILVLRNGYGARVEDLSTGKIVETHINNSKFLRCPDNEIQINEWIEVLSANDNASPSCVRRTMDLLHLEHTRRPNKRLRTEITKPQINQEDCISVSSSDEEIVIYAEDPSEDSQTSYHSIEPSTNVNQTKSY